MFSSDGFLRAAHRVWLGQQSFDSPPWVPPFHRMNAEAQEGILSFAEAGGIPRKDALAEFDRAGEG